MRILVDGRPVSSRVGGVGRIVRQVSEFLSRDPACEVTVLTDEPGVWAEASRIRTHPTESDGTGWAPRERFRYEQGRLRRVLRRLSPDLYWATWNTGVPFGKSCPAILTVHDVIPLRHGDFFGSRLLRACYRWNLRLSLRSATSIVTVSEATKRDVVRRCGTKDSKIHVIHPGIDARFQPRPDPAEESPLEGPYLLSVGTTARRKNMGTLLLAFDRLKEDTRFERLQLCLPGSAERFRAKFAGLLGRMKAAEAVRFPGFIEEERLPAYYRHASAFVLPSREEGFGLPLGEAMGCGAPVVCGSDDSIPEVVGEAALRVDVTDPAAMAEGIRRVLTDEGLAASLREKGLKRTEGLRWEKSLESMRRLIERTASPRR